jgi:TetR/AcrR family transcriptional regulator, cholesterol catabolism regulator
MTDVKERIQQKAHDLFMHYGVRSVTMDEIALQLGISKKTIYHFFSDKNELVDEVMNLKIKCSEQNCLHDKMRAKDPVHEMFLAIEMMQEMFENMNPAIMNDLEKFHPSAFKKFYQYKYSFIYAQIKDNVERGIEQGLYRNDFNADIIIKLRLETMLLFFNQSLFPSSKYSMFEVARELTEIFLFGIVTLKGHKLVIKYQKERIKKLNKDVAN